MAAAVAVLLTTAVANAQSPSEKAERDAVRAQLAQLLATAGPKKGIEISFRRADRNAYNFGGKKRDGLVHAEELEVIVGVTADKTIAVRVYPRYGGGYVNLDKVRNGAALMRKLLNLNDQNFLFWGADESGDIFAGYTISVDGGFPDKDIELVLNSLSPLDKYFGEMMPFIKDGVWTK